ncbi:NGG1 [Candida oxycetoniae]|uniref:NGG1 n=1 Tax=Candida oxycetoniae TaxID=497107 RepID=A0AAI9SVM3_9ASCO|nr:NGG1 [Candida oxycetoniae]KAI3403903.2 NGG1 [Candida oxycetoniae]
MPDVHAASTILDDIINELKLTYDSSVGLLDGDSIQNMPNVNTLTNLNKLLKNLWKQLNEVELTDDKVLSRINSIKARKRKFGSQKENNRKRTISELDEQSKEEENEQQEGGERKGERKGEREGEREPTGVYSKRRKTNVMPNSELEYKQVYAQENNNSQQLNSKDDPVPPIQSGSFTQENDTRLKNPHSEYVEPQTLSAEAIAKLGLYSEDNDGLETHGTEFLKKKYGVASYPENDLLDLLPGSIPNIDFSKNKPPTNQVLFTTFQSYIESYFRPFNNDDLKFLSEKNVIPPGFESLGYEADLTPFVIPKLGRFYADVWIEEDPSLAPKLNSPVQYSAYPAEESKAKGSVSLLNDDVLYTEEISCGPLSSRLLSAILSNHEGKEEEVEEEGAGGTGIVVGGGDNVSSRGEVKEEANDNESSKNLLAEDEVATQLNSNEDYRMTTETSDYQSIEERLKRELKYIGIFMNLPLIDDSKNTKTKLQLPGRIPKRSNHSIIDNDEWIKNKEDDEVCAKIRALQRELKEVNSRNRANKKKLIPIVEEHIAYQEYCTILEELDKQVDQAYMKRSKGKGKKKKVDTNTPQQRAVNSGLRVLLEKRKRWIDNIGILFPPSEIMKRVPNQSVMIKEGEVEAETIENGDFDNNTSSAVSKLI